MVTRSSILLTVRLRTPANQCLAQVHPDSSGNGQAVPGHGATGMDRRPYVGGFPAAGRPQRRLARGARMTDVSSPVAVHAVTATHVVRVPVTTVWASPESPRPVDAPIVADEADAAAWL